MDVRERENALVDALNMGGKCDTRHGPHLLFEFLI